MKTLNDVKCIYVSLLQLRYTWFSAKRNKSFNEAKETRYSSWEETSCIDMSIIHNAMADSIRINDRSL